MTNIAFEIRFVFIVLKTDVEMALNFKKHFCIDLVLHNIGRKKREDGGRKSWSAIFD